MLLRSEEEYMAALSRFEELLEAASGTAESEERCSLAVLIDAYEDAHYPIDPPDSAEAKRFREEQEKPLS
jgi:HTH-type transcriptional regulator / antitoxin HigA